MRRIPLAAALIALLLVPAGARADRAVPRGFFGVDFDRQVQYADSEGQDENWGAMASNGVESARVIFDWRKAQPSRDQPPTFATTDRIVRAAAAHGVRLLPIVLIAPPWARVEKNLESSRPKALGAYAAYLKALVARYGPRGSYWKSHPLLPKLPIRAWQIWNEPDMAYQWQPRKEWQHNYGRLLARAYKALRAADPGAKVVAAALTNYSWSSLDKLYRHAQIRAHSDVIALNTYTRYVRNLVEILRRNREVMDKHGAHKVPIWVTEFGASASKGRFDAGADDNLQVTDSGLAKLVSRAYDKLVAERRKLGVARAYWYTWASSYDKRTRAIFDFTGLVRWRNPDMTPRKALKAYRSRARAYEGCKKDALGACAR